jgi:DNA mismatch repair protein MutL
MSRIAILPPALANQIAAGEVIERPASIVKELVENALDAQATTIEVVLEGAGRESMVVTDDGEGMTREELVLAVQRHATSKVHTAQDLAQIRTLGFRGEALPSIAAVAHLHMTSRPRDGQAMATQITLQPGEITPAVSEVGAPIGTVVAVRDLFATIPARRKFLKGDRTELAHIQEMLLRLAIAHPDRRFTLTHGGRRLLAAHSRGGLESRLTELFGADTMAQTLSIAVEGPVTLRGVCGTPETARSGASQAYVILNGRPIRDRVIAHAITAGYRTHIAPGLQPFVVLNLTCDSDLVDVNVHPTKQEVRFVESGAVHHLVEHAVRATLDRHQGLGVALARSEDRAVSAPSSYPHVTAMRRPQPLEVQEALALAMPLTTPDTETTPVSGVRILGQLAETYLLCETANHDLLAIDQHAAHERIGFDAFKRAMHSGEIPRQLLLTPCVVTASPQAVAAAEECRMQLETIGWRVEPFGGNDLVVTEVPQLLQDSDIPTLLRRLLHDLATYDATTSIDEVVDHCCATMACHRQIRAGDRLSEEEIAHLIDDMSRGNSADRCPHGRPTWIIIPRTEIAKWFHRPA